MLLFTHIRLAHCFATHDKRMQCVQARLQALSVLGRYSRRNPCTAARARDLTYTLFGPGMHSLHTVVLSCWNIKRLILLSYPPCCSLFKCNPRGLQFLAVRRPGGRVGGRAGVGRSQACCEYFVCLTFSLIFQLWY